MRSGQKKMSANMRYMIIMILLFALFTSGFSISLPSLNMPEPSVLYDVNGQRISGLAERSGYNVDLEQISPYFLNAVIAVEDKNFRQHHGVDISGILRAMFTNLRYRKIVEGGSTITQQTAKNIFLSNERTIVRKIKELYYALLLERKYSKDEILAMYCNTIYFGQGAYGIEAAALTFFGSHASELDLAQAALLAGLPRWPSQYDPYINPDQAKLRQETVLDRMTTEGYINEDERQAAAAEKLTYQKSSLSQGEAPYFVAMVREYLSEKYGERQIYQGGLRIYSTLDLDMQRAANQAVQNGMKERPAELQTALVAVDTASSQIRALVGGKNYSTSQLNRAYAQRQPGSTFKPFVYSLAIEQGWTAADQIMCEKVAFEVAGSKPYRPTDYGDEPYHWKEFTLKEAVMVSDNVVAVRINEMIGPKNAAAYAERFGFRNLDGVLSLPLGSNAVRPIDMAAGYAVFANGGSYTPPSYILRVEDQNGNVLEEKKASPQRIINQENAYIITNMLNGVLQPGGTASNLRERAGRTAAAKTGTTDEFKDAWFVGYTPQLSCAVWVGYDRNQAVNLYGGVAAGPIWADFIKGASAGLPEQEFQVPYGVTRLPICLDSGFIATEYCPRSIDMAFKDGTEPEDLCPLHLPEEYWDNEDNGWRQGNDKDNQTTRPWWQLW
jgi:1A family penicillin-binding protein